MDEIIRPRGQTARERVIELKSRPCGWVKAIGELIDNSCGNGATKVNVRISKAHCAISDNGNGCDEKMFAAIQSIGWHQEDPTHYNPTSRFGIGAKDAFLWLGGPTEIYSFRDGYGARATRVDWEQFGDEWDYPDGMRGEKALSKCHQIGLKSHGVMIRMMNHSNRQITTKMFRDLRQRFQAQHWAAVDAGVQIRFVYLSSEGKEERYELTRKQLPEFAEGYSMDSQHILADGRKIRIIGGVLSPSERLSRPGFEYIFGHRVLIECGGVGAGELCFERVYFRVYLEGDKEAWKVNVNKDGLNDDDLEQLEQCVYSACLRLLEHAQSEAFASFEDPDVFNMIEDALNEAEGTKHPAKHGPAINNSGAVNGNGRGSRHKKADVFHDMLGDRTTPPKKGRNNGKRIRVYPCDFEDENAHLIGTVEVQSRVIRVNTKIDLIREWQTVNPNGLLSIALALWTSQRIKFDANGYMRSEPLEFDAVFSALLVRCTSQLTTA